MQRRKCLINHWLFDGELGEVRDERRRKKYCERGRKKRKRRDEKDTRHSEGWFIHLRKRDRQREGESRQSDVVWDARSRGPCVASHSVINFTRKGWLTIADQLRCSWEGGSSSLFTLLCLLFLCGCTHLPRPFVLIFLMRKVSRGILSCVGEGEAGRQKKWYSHVIGNTIEPEVHCANVHNHICD